MKPIPKAAMPVVKVLRRDVPRPKRLPVFVKSDKVLRWGNICPMGLHPKSLSVSPIFRESFADGECDDDAVEYFYGWWDFLPARDARAAVDAVWGRKRSARK